MSAERLLAHYERVGDAPDAVGRLRRFALDLAVRGKLAPQDADDDAVNHGLLRPEPERKRPLGRTGANLGPVTLDEVPIVLPASWRWSRLFQLCVQDAPIVYGILQPGPDTRPEGVPYIRPSEIENGRIILSDIRHTTHEIARRYVRASVKPGDLIFTIVGTIGATAIVPHELDGGNITQSSCRLRVDARLVDRGFLLAVLRSSCVIDQISRMKLGTAVPRLNIAHVRAIAVPLPPLAEQRRIVAKLDELMALCNRLEAARAEREATRERFAASSLARLGMPDPDPVIFAGHARFALDNFPALTTRCDQINQLRQTILNLAVRGKLVPPDPTDEPASEVLRRIHCDRRHKRRLAQLNAAELETTLPAIPMTWTWTVVDQIASDDDNAITDGPFGAQLKTEHYVSSPGYRVVRLQNIGPGFFRDESRSYIDQARFNRLSKHQVVAGDLVVAGLVDPRVRCCQLPADIGPAVVKADCYRFAVHPLIASRFALHYLNSPVAQEFAAVHHHGMTLTRIGLGNFRHIPFPLPPLAEQRRIVAKVDDLMAVCDRLESGIASGDDTRRRLLEALLREALDEAAEKAA